jgi:hypothetical protein
VQNISGLALNFPIQSVSAPLFSILKQESWFSKYSNSDKVSYIAVRNFSHQKDYKTRLKFMQTCSAAHQVPDKGTARKKKTFSQRC